MLMKSPSSTKAAERLLQVLDAVFARLGLGARQLYRATKHRRQVGALAAMDDHLLADVGLTRDDLRHAIAQPLWRDPTETLGQRASAARPSRFAQTADANRRALAEFDDGNLGSLSRLGLRIHRESRQHMLRPLRPAA